MRIKATDVTAAYRAAVGAAGIAGIDTSKWGLRIEQSSFQIVSVNDDTSRSIVYVLGTNYREAFDGLHAMMRAWEMVPRVGAPGRWPCWHVQSSDGLVYGVAASTMTAARNFLNARLRADGDNNAHATTASLVDVWDVDYGTVFCYGEGKVVSSRG